jgi:hypothetical protein
MPAPSGTSPASQHRRVGRQAAAGLAPCRATSAIAADTIWVTASPGSHDMLVRQAGHSDDEYER